MEADAQNKLLLYWSGEADEKQSIEAEAFLETDNEARRYFEELGGLDALRDDFAELPATLPSRTFAAGAVAKHLAEKESVRPALRWISAAAASVIILFAIGLKSWPSDRSSQDQIANEQVQVPEVTPGSSRPKLSERLFVTRPHISTSDRISAVRDRTRQLRINLNTSPKS